MSLLDINDKETINPTNLLEDGWGPQETIEGRKWTKCVEVKTLYSIGHLHFVMHNSCSEIIAIPTWEYIYVTNMSSIKEFIECQINKFKEHLIEQYKENRLVHIHIKNMNYGNLQ